MPCWAFRPSRLLVTYAIERLQNFLPWNPQHLAAVGPDLAWNTAASFTTNTNWQSYTPETTMSYLTQMAGLATHNFWSAAVGIVVAVALIRGIKRTDFRHHRQLLGGHDAHPALRAAARLASSTRCCWSPRAFRRT